MALVLDNDMLEELLCGECRKYLSVLPVKVYKDNVIKCGRCSNDYDGGTVSLYEKLIPNYLFKCVNRYEGCNKLLMHFEVIDHEKVCRGGSYNCPICGNQFAGTAYELVQHYKDCHPQSVLNKNMFHVPLRRYCKESERYLFLKNNIPFIVLVENFSFENIVYLSVITLNQFENIKQQFFVKFMGKQDYKNMKSPGTKIKPCFSLKSFKCDYFEIDVRHLYAKQIQCTFNIILPEMRDVYEVPILSKKLENGEAGTVSKNAHNVPVYSITPTITNDKLPSVQLTDDFKKYYPEYQLTPCRTALVNSEGKRTELTCSNCGQFTGCRAFNCKSKEHITCWECRVWCGICNDQMDGYNAEVSFMNELLLLPCMWNCGRNFPGDELHSHQDECHTPVKRCPVPTCSVRLPIPKLLGHLYVTHSNFEYVYPLNLKLYLKNRNSNMDINTGMYFVQNKTFFQMFACSSSENGCKLYISACEDGGHFDMAVILNDESYNELFDNIINLKPGDNPKFYLKWKLKKH